MIFVVRWRNSTMNKEQGKKESRSPDRDPGPSKQYKFMVTQAFMEINKKVVGRWIP